MDTNCNEKEAAILKAYLDIDTFHAQSALALSLRSQRTCKAKLANSLKMYNIQIRCSNGNFLVNLSLLYLEDPDHFIERRRFSGKLLTRSRAFLRHRGIVADNAGDLIDPCLHFLEALALSHRRRR